MFAEYYNRAEELDEYVESWNDLAVIASDPNPFFESWCLLPALKYLDSNGVQVLVVWEDNSRQKMMGLLPLVVESKFRGLPLQRTTIWRHDYCFLSTPLIAKNHVKEVLTCIFKSINDSKELPSFVSLYWLANAGAIATAVSASEIDGFSAKGNNNISLRAVLNCEGDYERDFSPTLNKKKRKELKRNKNRLSELGDLVTVIIDASYSSDDTENAIQTFLTLENQGWKSEQQTAIACNAKHQKYFEESLRYAIKNGAAQIVTMCLDGTTIASVVLIRSTNKTHACSVKIASASEYQQYSLGSLLMLEVAQYAFENTNIIEVDSCAASDHPMINRLWRERKEIVNINVTKDSDYRGAIIPMMDYCVELVRKLQSVKA